MGVRRVVQGYKSIGEEVPFIPLFPIVTAAYAT
jgi:hypothetical protein